MAIICICRGTKSGGEALAECLEARLGYPLLGREVVQQAAAELGVTADLLQKRMGDRPSLWSRFSSERRAYMVAVQACIAEHIVDGKLIYHGLAGGLLLRGLPGTFCLRLIAPLERRVEAVMAESGMDATAAEQFILDVDESRSRWVRVLYGEDIMDPVLYDLVMNLESMSVDEACAITAAAVGQPEFAMTEAIAARMEDFRLACRVKLQLAADSDTRNLELETTANRGMVVVSGRAPLYRTGGTAARVLELARSVPGVEEIRLEVDWYDPYP